MKENKYTVLAKCCICIGGAVGLVSNCLGIFYSPIAESLNLGIGRISVMATIISLASAFFMPVLTRLMKHFRINHLMAAGVIIDVIAYVIMSLVHDIRIYYLCSAFLGIGAVSYSNFPVSILLKEWYGDKNGSALGTALAFSGAFGALANPIVGRLIGSSGYESGMRVMAAFLLIVCLPCALTVRRNEQAVSEEKAAVSAGTAALSLGMLVFIIVTTSLFNAVNGMNSHMSSLAVKSGYSLEFSAIVVSVVMIANMLFKIAFGFAADRFSVTKAVLVWLAFNFTGLVTILFLRSVPAALLCGAALYAADFSNSTIAGPLIIQKVAKDRYSEIYPRVALFNTLSYALMTSGYGFLLDASGSYTLSLIVAISFAAIAFVLTLRLDRIIRNGTAAS